MRENKSVSLKAVCILLAVVLLIGCVAGGTLAYLFTQTDPVKNTFAASGIELTLTEHKSNADGTLDTNVTVKNNEYKLIPGKTYAKDPVVTITNDIDCYLFIKVELKANEYLTYTLNLNGWNVLDENEHSVVYYRTVAANALTKSWNLLVDNNVTVKSDLVLSNMTTAATNSGLTFTAYAVQNEGLSETQAWNVAQGLNPDGSEITNNNG